uniref:G-protein coupled receptors family 1 profile domain-containing protein n=1 Tax=Eptatretus burgeri TaxID=7764 RepID=A0A8C4R0S2_EPTBU
MNNCIEVDNNTLAWLEGSMSQTLLPVLYITVMCISIPSNIVALWVVAFKTQKYQTSTILMINLAIVDLALCHITVTARFLNVHCSTFFLTVISLDRFAAIVFPVRTLLWRTCFFSSVITGTGWVLMLLATVPFQMAQLVLCVHGAEYAKVFYTCFDVFRIADGKFLLNYSIFLIVIAFFLPFTIMMVCYISILHSILRLNTWTKLRTHQKAAVKFSITMLIALTFILVPCNIVLFSHLIHLKTNSTKSIYYTLQTNNSQSYIQWEEQVFDTLPILQVFPLTKHVEVCNFYHRYTSTVKDGIENKKPENHIV